MFPSLVVLSQPIKNQIASLTINEVWSGGFEGFELLGSLQISADEHFRFRS